MTLRVNGFHAPLLLTAAALLLGGCGPGFTLSETNPSGKLSIYEMAGRLGLRVTETTPTGAVMRNGGNTVMVFTDPGGQVFVNGRPVGESGGIVALGESQQMIYLPANLEFDIRQAMRRYEIGRNYIFQQDVPKPPGIEHPVPVRPDARGLGPVVIDPGHGGGDPGTSSPLGIREKAINLAVGMAVAENLRKRGVNVTMTRSSDKLPDLDSRAMLANQLHAKLFVSLHSDYLRDPSIRGYTVIMPRADRPGSSAAAQAIAKQLGDAGMPAHGVRKDDRGLRVLKLTTGPAVLVEMGFLSNTADASRLSSGIWQQRIADAIADGIVDFLRTQQ